MKWEQRTFDFRIWNVDYQYFQAEKDCYLQIQTEGVAILDHSEDIIESAILLQYTGVKDVNGKKIFEGDIVRYVSYYGGNEKYGVVVYHFSQFVITDHKHICILDMAKEKIILGNLFQNPELVEKYKLEI